MNYFRPVMNYLVVALYRNTIKNYENEKDYLRFNPYSIHRFISKG